MKRVILKSAGLIAVEADTEKDADEILDYAEKVILSIRRNRAESTSIADIMSSFSPRIDTMRDGTFKPAWEPKTLALKQIINYVEGSDYMIVAARPGECKSSFIRYEAWASAKQGKPVTIFNYENDPIEYARYLVAIETGVDSKKLKDPRMLSEWELDMVRTAVRTVAKYPIYINSFCGDAMYIARTTRKYAAEKKASWVGLDYVQLVRNGIERKVDDIGETTRVTRQSALQLGVPHLVAAQLSRDIERRGDDAEPQLSDLRDSGNIEQDCTIAFFPRSTNEDRHFIQDFPENKDERGYPLPRPKAVPIRFFVRKNRNGETGVSGPIKWVKSTGRFYTLDVSQ